MLVWPDYNSYIKWSDTTYGDLYMPVPKTAPSIRYANNESISLSEAGTELGVITRLQKKTITVTWRLDSDWKDRIEEKCSCAISKLTFGDYNAMDVRARLVSCSLASGSEYVARTDGLWTIQVQFTEV